MLKKHDCLFDMLLNFMGLFDRFDALQFIVSIKGGIFIAIKLVCFYLQCLNPNLIVSDL